jgi:hypothetical protein
MSGSPKSKIFLEQAGYRQRRLRDALRLMPFLGIVLFAIPLMWSSQGAQNAVALTYVFGVWIILIGLSVVMSRSLQSDEPSDSGKNAP